MTTSLRMCSRLLIVTFAATICSTTARAAEPPKLPKVGDKFKDYKFDSKSGGGVSLAALAKKGPVVLVVLRGYPGYQCPACTAQVAAFTKHASEFKKLGTNVVLVYPGAVDNLQLRATEFLKQKKLPDPMVLVLDPKYEFITPAGLRWDKEGETSYPSTFVLDKDLSVKYAKISKSHGDRSKPEDVLAAVRKLGESTSK